MIKKHFMLLFSGTSSAHGSSSGGAAFNTALYPSV